MTSVSDDRIRPAAVGEAAAIAACHVACWQEAYANLLPADYLRDLDVNARTASWQHVLSGPNVSGPDAGSHAVAVVDGDVVGFAGATASRDEPPVRDLELWGIYLRAAHHGTGLGQALLDAVVGDRPCSLWVARDNSRARHFYARNGFRPDGARKTEPRWFDLAEVRLVR